MDSVAQNRAGRLHNENPLGPALRHELECRAMARSKDPKVPAVEGQNARNAKTLRYRNDGRVNESNVTVGVAFDQLDTSIEIGFCEMLECKLAGCHGA